MAATALGAFASAVAALGTAQHAQAEAFLVSVRARGDGVELCRAVLEAEAGGEAVRTHAALALRDAALRRYEAAAPAQRAELRAWTLRAGLAEAAARRARPAAQSAASWTVLVALAEALAAQWKRAYLDEADAAKRDLLLSLRAMLLGAGPTLPAGASAGAGAEALAAADLAAAVLRALVVDFASPRTTSAGAPLEFHLAAARKFQALGLLECFELAMLRVRAAAAAAAAAAGAPQPAPPAPGDRVLALAVETLDACLAWSFQQPGSPRSSDLDSNAVQGSAAAFASPVAPGRQWTGALVAERPLDVLGALYGSVRGPDPALARGVRQCVASLAALSGDVFPDEQARRAHVVHALSLAFGMASAPAAESSARDLFQREPYESRAACEMADACVVAARAAVCAPFDALVASGHLAHLLELASVLTRQSAPPPSGCASWVRAALERLLSVWAFWAHKADLVAGSEELRRSALALVSLFMETRVLPPPAAPLPVAASRRSARLESASTDGEDGDDEDDDEGEGEEDSDEALIAVAARIDVVQSAGVAATALRAALGRVRAAAQAPGSADRDGALDALALAACFAARLLADPHSRGETPCVPEAVHAAKDPEGRLAALSSSLLDLLREEEAIAASPWVAGRVLFAATRWAWTYVVAPPPSGSDEEPGIEPSVTRAFRETRVVDFLVERATLALSAHAGDADAARGALALLAAVSRCDGGDYRPLARAHVEAASHPASRSGQWAPLDGVGAEGHAQLLRVLCARAYRAVDLDMLRQLLAPLSSRLEQLVAAPPRARASADLARLAELFRGVSLSSSAVSSSSVVDKTDANRVARISREFVLESMETLWSVVLGALPLSDADAVLPALLGFTFDFLDVHGAFLSPSDAARARRFAREAVTAFARASSAQSFSERVEEERDDERAANACLAIRIIGALLDRHMLDFSERVVEDDESPDEEARDIMESVRALLPLLVSRGLMKHPNVTETYFELISAVCRLGSGALAVLTDDLFRVLVDSIRFGAGHASPLVQRRAFESLASLATSQAQTEALGDRLVVYPDLLKDLCRIVIDVLAFSRCEVAVVDAAATALFALIACDVGAFEAAALAAARDADASGARVMDGRRLGSALAALVQGVRFRGGERGDKKAFRANVAGFVELVRGAAVM